jgi:hypothetical protein
MKLYARDIKGNIKEYSINQIENSESAVIRTGRLNGNLIETIIFHPTNIKREIASRIAKKRKEGYVSLKDLGAERFSEGLINFYNNVMSVERFLENNLPQYNTDANNNLKPMKCQKFKEGVVKYPAFAQPKLDGLRCVLRWETWTEGEGLFKQEMYGAKLRTKEGLEYYMPHITNYLNKNQFYKDDLELVYDGELYCHKMPLNQIKASCPMINSRGTLSNPSGKPTDISFWVFDLAIPDLTQDIRLKLQTESNIYGTYIGYVHNTIIHNDEDAMKVRDAWIADGFEGTVIREMDAGYAFGFRPSFIRKFKTHMDSEFLIIDLIPKPSDSSLPLFILKNDINDELFECNPSGNWEYQRDLMQNNHELIGMYATVRYRERTGTEKKLPFHANVIAIRKTKNEG